MRKLIKNKFSFYVIINMVIYMIQNEFDNEIKYRLFRTVTEILHPTISKKNISDYKIIVDEEILPVRVFYPQKVTGLDKAIIYIHGNGIITDCNLKYTDICKTFSKKLDRLVIAIEYDEKPHKFKSMYDEIYKTVKYLYKELERNNIDTENIVLMGDSTGASIITGVNYLNKNEIKIKKEILFYPVLTYDHTKFESVDLNKDFNIDLINNIDKYYSFIAYKKDINDKLLNPLKQDIKVNPDILFLVGKVDSLKDEVKDYYEKLDNKNNKYVEIPFSSHGFLKDMDKELETEVFGEIKKFI